MLLEKKCEDELYKKKWHLHVHCEYFIIDIYQICGMRSGT